MNIIHTKLAKRLKMKNKNGSTNAASMGDDVGVINKKRKKGYSKRVCFREQKGRLFIIRRCIVMLLCWHE
ncbi:unnamed protein product [Cuscuta campestris]|uniref:DVL-like protein n=1 Tax=Cuscuta campestris TaxID=132261 RepID=A0A484KMB2_9ASTE|nr:unnamed protein product [Cuscuta campestris]